MARLTRKEKQAHTRECLMHSAARVFARRGLQQHAEQMGKQGPLPQSQVALMTCVMANGFALERLLEGDAVPDELYGTMLMIFFAGLDTLKDPLALKGTSPLEAAGARA